MCKLNVSLESVIQEKIAILGGHARCGKNDEHHGKQGLELK